MSRATIVIRSDADRTRAAEWCARAPVGYRIEFKPQKRSLDQNSLLWARLSDVSRQVEWHGRKLTPTDWKDVFTVALRESRVVPGIDPGTFVSLGLHTSDMSREEMASLLDLIDAFAVEHEVKLSDHNAHHE